jgi:hypothetical protein
LVVVIQQANSLEIDKSLFQLLQFTQSLINRSSELQRLRLDFIKAENEHTCNTFYDSSSNPERTKNNKTNIEGVVYYKVGGARYTSVPMGTGNGNFDNIIQKLKAKPQTERKTSKTLAYTFIQYSNLVLSDFD